jgi:hypothetical protein
VAYPEVLIPPSVRPESPVEVEPVDDQTVVFSPQFARGISQRQTWGDPLWSMRLRYKGLSEADRALLKAAIGKSRGKGANLRVTPGLPLRGSFPATELLTNGDFSNGTTGWSAGAEYSISASDRVLRAKVISAISGGTVTYPTSTATATQYAPYVGRLFTAEGAGAYPSGFRIGLGSSASGSEYGVVASAAHGMRTHAAVPSGTTLGINLTDLTMASDGTIAGDYVNLLMASLSRCPLVDNGPNAFLRSDQFDNAAWTKTAVTVAGDNIAGPTGSVIADAVIETTATSTHELRQSVTVSSAAADYCFAIAIKPNSRSFVQLSIEEGTGATNASAFFNVVTGAVGTIANGANWANTRGFSRDLGNGWWYICIVGRKTNAATSLLHRVLLSTDGATVSYTGVAAVDAAYVWRATSAQSSVPVRLTQTITAATTGTSQSGRSLYVKGLPASTQGLLLTGEFVEINGELERVIAPLDSDAAGLGVLMLGRARAIAPADNDPVIVLNPMGRFIIQAVRETERYGLYTDIELDLIEAPA